MASQNLIIIFGFGNGLLHALCQAMAWANADILLIEPLGKKCIGECYLLNISHFVQAWMCLNFKVAQVFISFFL